jgi:hypothetical protein
MNTATQPSPNTTSPGDAGSPDLPHRATPRAVVPRFLPSKGPVHLPNSALAATTLPNGAQPRTPQHAGGGGS